MKRSVRPCYNRTYTNYSANSTYRAFRFSSEIQRPAGQPARSVVPRWRSRSFDHTFRKSLKPFSTFDSAEKTVSLHFSEHHPNGNVYADRSICAFRFSRNKSSVIYEIFCLLQNQGEHLVKLVFIILKVNYVFDLLYLKYSRLTCKISYLS